MSFKYNIALGGAIDLKSVNASISTIEKQLAPLKLQVDTAYIQSQLKGLNLSGIGSKKSTKTATTTTGSAVYDKTTQSLAKLNTQTENYASRLRSLQNSGALTSKEFTSFNAKLTELNTKLKSGEITTDQFKTKFQQLKNSTSETASEMMTFGERTKTAFSAITQWMTASTIFFGMVRAIKDVIAQVSALDKALVELNKVSDLTDDQISKVTAEAYRMGSQLAMTGTSVLSAITEFKRAGYTLEESQSLAKYAITLTNVAEGITDTGEAANVFVSILKGANKDISYASTLLDELNAISNTSAVGFDNLADMVQRIAGTMTTLGNSVEETTALVTGAYEVLQDERVAKGISLIGLRIAGLNEDMEEEAGLASKVGDAFKKYAGIDVMDSTGQLKDTFDILSELAEIYPKLTKNAQAYLLTEAAGKNRADVLAAVLTNWEGISKAMDTAANSAGSAETEAENYINSIEGKINKLKNAWQELATSFLSSDTVKWFIDIVSVLAEIVKYAGGLQTVLGLIVGSIGMIKALKMTSALKNGTLAIKGMTTAIATGTKTVSAFGVALNTALGIIGLIITAYELIKSVVSAFNQASEERLQNSLDNIEALKEEETTLKSLKQEYIDLSAVTDKNESQVKRLQTIREQLIKIYGAEAEALDFLNGKYEENTALLRGEEISSLTKQKGETQTSIDLLKKKISKEQSYDWDWFDWKSMGVEASLANKIREANEAGDVLKTYDLYIEELSRLTTKKGEGKKLSKEEEKSYSWLEQEISQQKEWIKEYKSLVDDYQAITERIEFLNSDTAKKADDLSLQIAKFLTRPVEEQIGEIDELERKIAELEVSEDYSKNKEAIDEITKAFKDQAEAIRNTDFAMEVLNKNLSALKELKTLEEEELKTKEKLLAVEKAREELAKAKDKRILAYRVGKGMVETQDTSAIQEAQENLNEATEAVEGTKAEQAIKQVEELQAIYNKAQLLGNKVNGKTLRETFLDQSELDKFNQMTIAERKAYLSKFLGGKSWEDIQAEDKAKLEADRDKYLPKYANGTTNASGGISMVGEKGSELRVLNKGDGIIPHETTKNLISFGNDPSKFVKSVMNNSNCAETISIGNISLPNVQNVQGFIAELKNLATPQRLRV